MDKHKLSFVVLIVLTITALLLLAFQILTFNSKLEITTQDIPVVLSGYAMTFRGFVNDVEYDYSIEDSPKITLSLSLTSEAKGYGEIGETVKILIPNYVLKESIFEYRDSAEGEKLVNVFDTTNLYRSLLNAERVNIELVDVDYDQVFDYVNNSVVFTK